MRSARMKLPIIEGIIKRRILINFQLEPDVISKHLPPIFKPKVVQGKSIIGVCLIRLEQIHPKRIPIPLGIFSENAAHRIAVQWNDENGKLCDGVYIFRRDSNSLLNYLLGGRLFPGEHHKAKFIVKDKNQQIDFRMISSNPNVNIQFEARYSDQLPKSSIFKSIEEISGFFKSGSVGYSPLIGKNCFQGMCLIPHEWNMTPLECNNLELSYFRETLGISDNEIKLDSMVIMRDIPHEWHSLKTMY
jgi:hypothetical protein